MDNAFIIGGGCISNFRFSVTSNSFRLLSDLLFFPDAAVGIYNLSHVIRRGTAKKVSKPDCRQAGKDTAANNIVTCDESGLVINDEMIKLLYYCKLKRGNATS